MMLTKKLNFVLGCSDGCLLCVVAADGTQACVKCDSGFVLNDGSCVGRFMLQAIHYKYDIYTDRSDIWKSI